MDAALAPLRLQGFRVLNYIDDWLILAQSQELAVQHRDVVLAHIQSLGLRLNTKKSVLAPAQRTTFLRVVWDSVTMRAQVVSCTDRIHPGHGDQDKARPGHHCKTFSESVRSHGSSIQYHSIRSPAHEALAVVVEDQG